MTFTDNLYALVVDDSDEFAELTSRHISKHSEYLNADYVTSGAEALDYIEDNDVHAVVSDFKMPEMDGIELLTHVNRTSDIPFILYTGFGGEDVALRAMRAGAEDYVDKRDLETPEILVSRIENAAVKNKAVNELGILKEGVENTGHGVLVADSEGNIMYANPALEETTGYSREEIIGSNPNMFSSDEHGQEFYEQMWRQLEEGNIWEGEILNETKDGDNYWIRQTISPITDNDGELDYLIGINTDITRKKKQDSRRELLNSLLRHDLSNEHQKAQGFVEMLQETDLSDQQQKYVDVIQSSVDHSIELLRDVRGLLEGNSGDFEGEETDVEDVVNDVLDSEGPRARRKDIEIETDLDGSYSVLAGPLLKQSLSNLVENAIVHPDEVSTVELEAKEAPDNPEVIELTVKDDGEGLPDDFSWERGFKGEDSDGTGVGTWLVKEIGETYGEGVEAGESEMGGAEFSMRLDRS